MLNPHFQWRHIAHAATCVALISSLAPTTASAALLASGAASLTDVHYELINLAPQSTPAPWISFNTSAANPLTGRLDATGQSDVPDAAVQSSWSGFLPSQAMAVTSTDGYTSAQATPTGLATSFAVDGGALSKATPMEDGSGRSRFEVFSQASTGRGIPSLPYVWDQSTDHVSAITPDTSWQPFDFTLSAHTEIVVHGHASAALSIQPEQGAWDVRNIGGDVQDEPLIGSGVQMALMLANPDFVMQPVYSSRQAFYADMNKSYSIVYDGVSADWTFDDPTSMGPQDRDLVLTLRNDSDKTAQGTLLLTGMSQFAAIQTGSTVPEPGTWALMGLGLLMLVGLRKQA